MPETDTVPYIDDGNVRHMLDVYPPGAPAGPAVLMVLHGGSLRHFITHNRNDGIVPASHAEKLHAALDAAGVPNELFFYDRPEKDHGIWAAGTNPPEFLDFLVHRIGEFLRRWA
jgi:acetyl esterase/lipase